MLSYQWGKLDEVDKTTLQDGSQYSQLYLGSGKAVSKLETARKVLCCSISVSLFIEPWLLRHSERAQGSQ